MKKNITSWELEQVVNGIFIEIPYSKKQGAWIAEITGCHPVYHLNRKFIDAKEDDGYLKTWEIQEGKVYCICPSTKYKTQYFLKMENKTIQELTKDEVLDMVK